MLHWDISETTNPAGKFTTHRTETEGVRVTLFDGEPNAGAGVDRVSWDVCLRGSGTPMVPSLRASKEGAAAECRKRAAQLEAMAAELELEVLAESGNLRPVWHLARSPGVRWCGADYRNVSTTDVAANADCPACREARAVAGEAAGLKA